MSGDKVELARQAYDAWIRGDFDVMATLVAEDLEFVPAVAAGVEGGSVRGRDEVLRFFENLDETWETFRVEPDEFRPVGDRVLMVGHVKAKGRGSGLELDQPMLSVLWFRDGKIARMQSFLDEGAALEAAEQEVRAR
jgi:ketosteroid isomerase-like protein